MQPILNHAFTYQNMNWQDTCVMIIANPTSRHFKDWQKIFTCAISFLVGLLSGGQLPRVCQARVEYLKMHKRSDAKVGRIATTHLSVRFSNAEDYEMQRAEILSSLDTTLLGMETTESDRMRIVPLLSRLVEAQDRLGVLENLNAQEWESLCELIYLSQNEEGADEKWNTLKDFVFLRPTWMAEFARQLIDRKDLFRHRLSIHVAACIVEELCKRSQTHSAYAQILYDRLKGSTLLIQANDWIESNCNDNELSKDRYLLLSRFASVASRITDPKQRKNAVKDGMKALKGAEHIRAFRRKEGRLIDECPIFEKSLLLACNMHLLRHERLSCKCHLEEMEKMIHLWNIKEKSYDKTMIQEGLMRLYAAYGDDEQLRVLFNRSTRHDFTDIAPYSIDTEGFFGEEVTRDRLILLQRAKRCYKQQQPINWVMVSRIAYELAEMAPPSSEQQRHLLDEMEDALSHLSQSESSAIHEIELRIAILKKNIPQLTCLLNSPRIRELTAQSMKALCAAFRSKWPSISSAREGESINLVRLNLAAARAYIDWTTYHRNDRLVKQAAHFLQAYGEVCDKIQVDAEEPYQYLHRALIAEDTLNLIWAREAIEVATAQTNDMSFKKEVAEKIVATLGSMYPERLDKNEMEGRYHLAYAYLILGQDAEAEEVILQGRWLTSDHESPLFPDLRPSVSRATERFYFLIAQGSASMQRRCNFMACYRAQEENSDLSWKQGIIRQLEEVIAASSTIEEVKWEEAFLSFLKEEEREGKSRQQLEEMLHINKEQQINKWLIDHGIENYYETRLFSL